VSATSPLIGPTDADMMLLRLDDRMRIMEQTATLPPGVVAFVPNGQPSTPVWTTFASAGIFAAGYSDYAGGYEACAFTKDPSGWVHLRGLYKFSPIGSYPNWGVGTLPVGYRPAAIWIFATMHSSGANLIERVDVNPTGAVTGSVTGGGNWDGAYGSLAGVSFDSGTPLLATSAGATIPDGWLFADGSTISAQRYGQLVARLKTTTLPDLRAAAPLGMVPIIKI
jgi:Phage Tail Collar Domain